MCVCFCLFVCVCVSVWWACLFSGNGQDTFARKGERLYRELNSKVIQWPTETLKESRFRSFNGVTNTLKSYFQIK